MECISRYAYSMTNKGNNADAKTYTEECQSATAVRMRDAIEMVSPKGATVKVSHHHVSARLAAGYMFA